VQCSFLLRWLPSSDGSRERWNSAPGRARTCPPWSLTVGGEGEKLSPEYRSVCVCTMRAIGVHPLNAGFASSGRGKPGRKAASTAQQNQEPSAAPSLNGVFRVVSVGFAPNPKCTGAAGATLAQLAMRTGPGAPGLLAYRSELRNSGYNGNDRSIRPSGVTARVNSFSFKSLAVVVQSRGTSGKAGGKGKHSLQSKATSGIFSWVSRRCGETADLPVRGGGTLATTLRCVRHVPRRCPSDRHQPQTSSCRRLAAPRHNSAPGAGHILVGAGSAKTRSNQSLEEALRRLLVPRPYRYEARP
jgi:hypothetical protein